MGLFDRLTQAGTAHTVLDQVAETITVAEMGQELDGATETIELLRESIADLELAFEDTNWRRLEAWGDTQFTREGLHRAASLCRVMSIANPLVRRGLALRTAYVWGGGVEIKARAVGGDDGQQDVNAVVQDFLDDKGNRKVLTGAAARQRTERTLGTDGNLLFACFTIPTTGRVQVRPIPFDEVVEIINNPEDASEPWFYKRTHTMNGKSVTTWYPDIDYRPRSRVLRAGPGDGGEKQSVMWDAPVIHLKVNDLEGWDFGVGDAYAAIAWARAYKEFLEDWAKLVKALSRFAWRATGDRRSKAQTMATRAAQAPSTNTRTGEPNDIAGMAVMGPGQTLEAIPKSGATIDSESGKPLAGMVAAALDVPLTMLLADPGQTGARAVAETLDRPTELMAGLRRDVWGDFYQQLLDYVIDAAVRAPAGALAGVPGRDEWGREVITLEGDTERTIEITWPDLTETDIKTLMEALEIADAMKLLPPLEMLKLVLAALKVDDVDEILEQVTDEAGNFVAPDVTAGDVAVNAFRRGEDPAEALK